MGVWSIFDNIKQQTYHYKINNNHCYKDSESHQCDFNRAGKRGFLAFPYKTWDEKRNKERYYENNEEETGVN